MSTHVRTSIFIQLAPKRFSTERAQMVLSNPTNKMADAAKNMKSLTVSLLVSPADNFCFKIVWNQTWPQQNVGAGLDSV